MNIIPPSFELLDRIDGTALLQKLELAGRVCYKSGRRSPRTPPLALSAGFWPTAMNPCWNMKN